MNKVIEKQRETKVLQSCDVLVAGGGIAGISAALAAARENANVLLIEKQCVLGGLATLGLITIYLPLCDGAGRQVSFGISEELLRLSIKHGAEDRYPKAWLEGGTQEERTKERFEVQYNPIFFALEVEQLLLRTGVKILYDTSICETVEENGSISHVIVENKSGRYAIGVKSVVDCTGDADICKFSGAKTQLFAQKNILANWYYYIENGKVALEMLGAADIPEEYKEEGKGPKPLVDKRFTGIDGVEKSEMIMLGHSEMLKRILKKRNNNPSHTPVNMPTIAQLRMTRRINGVYTLSDKEKHKRFSDSIGMISDWRKPGPVYEIPFSTLYGKEVKNLITAGRCISVNDSMWDISRVIPACAVTGQAAGIAASMTDDFSNCDISSLQKKLVDNGVVLHEADI
ncbi:MAG: FAD-dependent oxidoreductase [Eubacteriales bacterium]|nr:FAD-dependent oxidoreductase [Eubacteriales bacterium]